MSEWIEVAKVADCPEGSGLECVAGGRIVALFHVDGEFYAIDGVCSHQGGPLAKGELNGCLVSCPWHGWQYDVRDGQQQISPTIKQPCFELRVDGDSVLVRIEDEP